MAPPMMLRFKNEVFLAPKKDARSSRKFHFQDLDDCFSDDLRDDLDLYTSANRRTSDSRVTLMEAEQGVKAALFNKLVVDGAPFDSAHFYHQTAVFLAAEYDLVDALQLLTSAGADLNSEDMFGETALFLAVSHTSIESVRWLVEQGADVSHKTPEGETALHIAAMTSSECVDILANAGADVNAPKTKGATPLMMAAVNQGEAVGCLIRHGADVNFKSIYGDTALLYAIRSENVEAIRLLAPLVDDIDYDGSGDARCGYHGLRMNSALGVAVEGSNPEVVDVLLENGAKANGTVSFKNVNVPLLHVALGNKAQTPIEVLVSRSGKPSNWRECVPSNQIVSSLIKYGACVDNKEPNGETPLMTATAHGDLDIMNTLIQNGADVNATNKSGFSSLYAAANSENDESLSALRLLLSSGAQAGFELKEAILGNRQKVVEAMVDSGAVPTLLSDRRGSDIPVSPLYVALYSGRLHIASLFVARGFVTKWDLMNIHKDFKTSCSPYSQAKGPIPLMQVLNEHKYYKGGIPENLSSLFSLEDLELPKPCSLFLWSLVNVSERMGFDLERSQRVKSTGLPVPLQNKLMFKESK